MIVREDHASCGISSVKAALSQVWKCFRDLSACVWILWWDTVRLIVRTWGD